MGAYYYGNVGGIYRSVGSREAERLMHASLDNKNLIFCRLAQQSMCGELRPQRNAMASSSCFQAGVYPKNSADFLRAEFYPEEQLLEFIRTEQTPELKLRAEKLARTPANNAACAYLCAALTQKVFFGGELPELILDAADAPFEAQVRNLADMVFTVLPARLTEGCCICTGEMKTTDEIRQIIRLLPADSSSATAVRASSCKERMGELRDRAVKIVAFWSQNTGVVRRFEQICSYLSDWETIQQISRWENSGVADADTDTLIALLHESTGKCWGGLLTELVQKPELQEKLAALEMDRLARDSAAFTDAQSLVLYITEQLSLFGGEHRRRIAAYANELYMLHTAAFADDPVLCCREITVYMNAGAKLQEELPQKTYEQTLDSLYRLVQENLQQRLTEVPSVETLKRCLTDLQSCDRHVAQQICATLCKQLVADSKNKLRLLRELKSAELELKRLMEAKEYQSLFAEAKKCCEQQTLEHAAYQSKLELLSNLYEAELLPYQQIAGENPELLKQVFSIVYKKDYTLDYDKLYDNRELALRFISEARYQELLSAKVGIWKNEKRKEITRIVTQLSYFIKTVDFPQQVQRTADELNAIFSRCNDVSDLRRTAKNKLDDMLKQITCSKRDSISLFDPLEGLCDVQIWRDKFNGKTVAEKPDKSSMRPNPATDQPGRGKMQTEKRPKKANTALKSSDRSMRSSARMSWVLLAGIAVTVLLLIAAVFGTLSSVQAGRQAAELSDAYQAWRVGQSDALTRLDQLGESYEPARIVAELLRLSDARQPVDATPQPTEPEKPQLPVLATNPHDTRESETQQESELERTDAQLAQARRLWNDGGYTEAKALLDELAAQDMLTFDAKHATREDTAELEYGALCSLLAVSDATQGTSYRNLLLYLTSDRDWDERFDFEKPIFCFVAVNGEHWLCAYDKQAHNYQLWCSEAEAEETVQSVLESAVELDLLSMRRIMDIRDKLQQR